MTWLLIISPLLLLFAYEVFCAVREEWRKVQQMPPWIEPGRARRRWR